MRRLTSTDADFAQQFARLVHGARGEIKDVRNDVAAIIERVRVEGDAALFDLTARFDRWPIDAATVRLDASAIAEAAHTVDPDVRDALRLAHARIRAFHAANVPQDSAVTDETGVRAGVRWRPISAVGLYVPGGLAAYPSSLLMNAVPARVAGVERVVMVTPTPDGVLNPVVLAAAHEAGVEEIYRIGGAQAVAALVYGTASVPRIDKIVGPGNTFVTEAKRQLFGQVGIDLTAGPSEVLVVADADNDPDWLAADLLSQAEHDPAAQAILITDHAPLADAVGAALARQLADLPKRAIAEAAWRDYGAIIVVGDLLREAPALIDALAAEHLELCVAEPEALFAQVRHAGSVFFGRWTPEVIGDYVGGPNHVLPTSRSARFMSGLSVYDFMKRTTWLDCPKDSLTTIGRAAATLAEAEGLDGHRRAMQARLDALEDAAYPPAPALADPAR